VSLTNFPIKKSKTEHERYSGRRFGSMPCGSRRLLLLGVRRPANSENVQDLVPIVKLCAL